MDIRCLTDDESELYEKLLNEEAMETGIKLFEQKSDFVGDKNGVLWR